MGEKNTNPPPASRALLHFEGKNKLKISLVRSIFFLTEERSEKESVYLVFFCASAPLNISISCGDIGKKKERSPKKKKSPLEKMEKWIPPHFIVCTDTQQFFFVYHWFREVIGWPLWTRLKSVHERKKKNNNRTPKLPLLSPRCSFPIFFVFVLSHPFYSSGVLCFFYTENTLFVDSWILRFPPPFPFC